MMSDDIMNPDLAEEIEYMINALSKSGFFSTEEILEILEDEFIGENVDFSQFNNGYSHFSKLKLHLKLFRGIHAYDLRL